MKKTLEELLIEGGEIKTSRHRENLILAIFICENKIKAKVFSDRGFEHLFLTLNATFHDDQSALKAADEKFRYALNWKTLTPIDAQMNSSYLHIYCDNGQIQVDRYVVGTHDKYAIPGVWVYSRKAPTVISAIENVMNFPGDPVRVEGLRPIPEKQY